MVSNALDEEVLLKKYFFIVGLLLAFTPLCISGDDHGDENATIITSPEYCGKLYGSFTSVNLNALPTDGDLETGTLITLTTPPNLFARLQQLQSEHTNALRVGLGYNIPCTNYNVDLTYFHYIGSDLNQIRNIQLNQLIQSFLGGAYSTLTAWEAQKINLVNALLGKRCIIDEQLILQSYIGLSYGDIFRDLNVTFTDLIDAPPKVTDSRLDGVEKSEYWGVGPIFGSNFSYPISPCISLQGTFDGGVLWGRIRSSIDAIEENIENEMPVINTFKDSQRNYKTVPFINSQLAIAFHPASQDHYLDWELKVGYELDYYFSAVDRINPFNGFVINQDPVPVKQSSHLGLGGPFIKLLIRESDYNYYSYLSDCHTDLCNYFCGVYGDFTSSWLKPVSDNDDLVYAVLATDNGNEKKQQARFNHSWNGTYKLGYQTSNNLDFHCAFFRFKDQSVTKVMASDSERINSVNASGSASVTYGAAQSKVKYSLNQVDFLAGKRFFPFCDLEMLLSAGLRYASLKRNIWNQYTGGIPPIEFESKRNHLKSDFDGTGLVFAMEPTYVLCDNLQLTGYFSTSLLMGRLKSTLDQVNNGTDGASSNTLRTPSTKWIVPVVDANAGLSYHFCLFSQIDAKIEAGYQFAQYFKAINLVFPNFLTGLQQNNSDLRLHGPYLTINFEI